MARLDTGSVTVTNAGTRVQLSANIASGARIRATSKVISIEITPRSDNGGTAMYFGSVVVAATYGSRILKGVSKTFTFDPGTDAFNAFYVDADAAGDVADWVVIFE